MNYQKTETMTTQTPKLRFPEFPDSGNKSYKKQSFKDIFLFSTGKNIKQNEASPEFETPCVRYGELYHMYNEVIAEVINKTNLDKSELLFSDGDEILLPSAGEDPLDIGSASALTVANVAIGRTINVLKPQKVNIYHQIFVAYYINQKLRKKISTLAKGSSISNVYNSDLKTLEITLPSFLEQTKIANFLTAIDEKIQALKQKKTLLEQYKKGIMQQIFSQELRFKNDDGSDFDDWEEKSLGEISNIKRGASPRPISDKKWFSNISSIGWVRISDVTKSNKFLNKTEQYLSDEGVKKSRFLEKGNLIMSICATIGKPIYTNIPVCIHDGFVVFDDIQADREYVYYYLDFIQDKWYQYGQPGSQVNLNTEIVSNEIINFPSISEQKKIANFLTAIDEKIEKASQQITATETYKKGLLQQMFI
jgi:type I restriction enzyme, S subunit